MASEAVAGPSQIVCECGCDHRGTGNRRCPAFIVFGKLNNHIRKFLEARELFEFGKGGPLAHSLAVRATYHHNKAIEAFRSRQAASEKSPPSYLAEGVAKLRRYFDQIADGFAVDAASVGPRAPHSVLPKIVGDEDKTLRDAKQSVIDCAEECHNVISEWLESCGFSLTYSDRHEHYLPKIDNAFKAAFEKTSLLPKTQNGTIQDLVNRSYEIWKESRRLMCGFEREVGKVIENSTWMKRKQPSSRTAHQDQ